jgi:hypothetical protein
VRNEKSIVRIPGRMSLGLEESVEIPKGAFDISICLHLLETHLKQDFYELLAGFHEHVQISILYLESLGGGVKFLELDLFPRLVSNHSASYLWDKLYLLLSVLLSFCDDKCCVLLLFDQFPPL